MLVGLLIKPSGHFDGARQWHSVVLSELWSREIPSLHTLCVAHFPKWQSWTVTIWAKQNGDCRLLCVEPLGFHALWGKHHSRAVNNWSSWVKMNVIFETDVYCCYVYTYFQNFSYWNWLKLPSQSTTFVHLGLYSDLWLVGTACGYGNTHMDKLLLTGCMEFLKQLCSGWNNCWVPPGAAVELLKKITFGGEGGWWWMGREGWEWGKKNRKKNLGRKTWHFCLRYSMLCWCHPWNVSEVSVINTSIRNFHILYLYITYSKESHTKT